MVNIVASTINDAWHQAVYQCWMIGEDYKVEKDSCVGQLRRQLEFFSCEILCPETRPLAIQFPEGISLPTPNLEHQIKYYAARYLLSDLNIKNEAYTYGERIISNQYILPPNEAIGRVDQLYEVIEKLKLSLYTDQATIEIGCGSDVLLDDPPCLRVIDLKAVNGKLNMSVYFRSCDLWSGFPTHLGGLQILNEYIAQEVGLETGKLFVASAGLYLYEMYFSIVKQRFKLVD